MDYLFLMLTFALCFPVAHYATRYSGWVHKEYHQDDLEKFQASLILCCCSLIATIIAMFQA